MLPYTRYSNVSAPSQERKSFAIHRTDFVHGLLECAQVADWKKFLDSTVTQVGQGMKAAGEVLGQATQGARKVAGIGVGTIELVLDDSRYWLGDSLAGVVKLQLSEPTDAKNLSVTLQATRTRLAVGKIVRGGEGSDLEREIVVEYTAEICGTRTYTSGDFRFAIDIPAEIDARVEVDGLIGDVLRAAQAAKSMTESPLRWRLVCALAIPWKRNVVHKISVPVRPETRPQTPPPTAAAAPASATCKLPRVPAAMQLPNGWRDALSRCFDELACDGWVVIHYRAAPPVAPPVAMKFLSRYPDLPAELLQFYGVMDGLEVVVGKPRAARDTYESVRIARDHGGMIGCMDDVFSGDLGQAVEQEFGHDGDEVVRYLKIPGLNAMFTEHNGFLDRDGAVAVFGDVRLAHSDNYGLTRAEEIRQWGRGGSDDVYATHAPRFQAALTERERLHPDRWWVLLGDDHGCLGNEPLLLRWAEMLTACLEHLRGK